MMGAASACGGETTPNWVKVSAHAEWAPRDSQAELVYGNKMWIFGGWVDTYQPCPRDVWSSPDGKTWALVKEVAPWTHSDLVMTLVFKNKMWLMGGGNNGRLPGHSVSNEVWCSSDGANWELAAPHAGWSPRTAAAAVVFKDRMWVLGGVESCLVGDETMLQNDVWYSDDGKQWTCATAHTPWSPRAFHQAIVFDGKIWVLGGGAYIPKHHALNDVWCSADGVTWTRVAEVAPWVPRLWFSSVIYRDRLWVLGGWSQSTGNFGDVWFSKNGREWTEWKSAVTWKARHEHSAFVFQDKIWVAGGHANPVNNEVWSLTIEQCVEPQVTFQSRAW